MNKKYLFFATLISFLILIPIGRGITAQDQTAEQEFSEEDLEVIEYMDVLENLDYFEEDVAFLENMDLMDQDGDQGEQNEE